MDEGDRGTRRETRRVDGDQRPLVARLAIPDDASELVRLACVMFASMGWAEPDDAWRVAAAANVAERLGGDVVAAVVPHPTVSGRAVASGAASVSRRLPTPTNPSGAYAYVQWVATDDEFRRRGGARAVMTTMLAWLDAHDVGAVELHATAAGEPLYRALGFWEGTGPPALRRRTWDPPPQ